MVTCIVRYSSANMSHLNYPQKLHRAMTYDSSMPVLTSRRKRLLSEQNSFCCNNVDELSNNNGISTNKRTKKETHDNESKDNSQHHALSDCFQSTFDITTQCPFSSDIKHQQSFIESTMLLCQQTSSENPSEEINPRPSLFITDSQLTAYINSMKDLVIIDCGSPLRYNERRIQDAFLLNINDRLSRKRLVTRGLKTFLDPQYFQRLTQSKLIILYDDTHRTPLTCSTSSVQSPELPSIVQCIFDQIKKQDPEKIIYVLHSSFEQFYQNHPTFCYVSSTNENFIEENLQASPSIDLDSYQMSEVIPGLYLGNAHDAKDFDRLKSNDIKAIVNISTNIPCYYQHDQSFDYLQLNLQDSIHENLLEHFETTFQFIQAKLSANENLLVHCQGGISRSPSFIIGYLMRYHKKTFTQAYSFVKEKRKIINPNLNFHAQLVRYEQMMN